jgi:hypothetical protein
MQITLDLNPDEALALIQICERDIMFPEVATKVISECERYRHEWANDVRNLAYLRAEPKEDTHVYILDGHDNLIDITPEVLRDKGAI